jgi:hypothetical protein
VHVRQTDGTTARGVLWNEMADAFTRAISAHLEQIGVYEVSAAPIGVVMEGYYKTRTWRGGSAQEFQVTKITAASADLAFVFEMTRPPRARAA